jgi:hypothetical protein
MEILDAPESFEIKVPIREYWIPMFLFGGGSMCMALIIGLMIYRRITDDFFILYL